MRKMLVSMMILLLLIPVPITKGYGQEEIQNEELGTEETTIEETETNISPTKEIQNTEPEYVLATDSDFSGSVNGSFRYIGTDAYVEIPHVIKGVNVTSYQSMFMGTSVKGVKSTNTNVTSMTYMFRDSKATELDLSSFDTSNVTTMERMFRGSNAIELDVSSFDTSKVTSMIGMFYDSQATELDLSSFDTSKVTNMQSMFNGSKATELDLSSFDTSNVLYMLVMFYGSKATELDLSSFDTSNVTNMGSMFGDSQATVGYARTQEDANRFNESTGKPSTLHFVEGYKLATDSDFSGTANGSFRYIGTDEYVEIPHLIKGVNVTSYEQMFNGTSVKGVKSTNSKVTNMSNMFYSSQATELDVSNLDTSNVTNMSNMFRGSQATLLDLSSFDTSNVTNMNSMFQDSQATELDLSSFDTSNVTNMGLMFYQSLATELDLSSFDTSNVTNMQRMFRYSQVTTGYARTQEDADKFNRSRDKPSELTFKVFDGKYVLATDSDFSGSTNGSFRYIGNDEYVEVPHEIKGVSVTSYSSMFRDTSVKGVKSTNTKVTAMNHMFSGSQATELDLSKFDTSKVTDMNHMFSGSQATELDLSKFDTSKVTGMHGMFMSSQVTELDLSSFDTSNVNNMSNMFRGSQATELDLSSFDTSNVSNMHGMFWRSQATVGYARTQEDANRFNSSFNRPTELFFKVKSTPPDLDITFSDNGNNVYQQQHSTTVDVTGTDLSELHYQWSESETGEVGIWESFTNGSTITKSEGTGDYYLHVKATSNTGTTIETVSNVFKFDNTAPTTPNVEANTDWSTVEQTVTITGGVDDHSGVDKTVYRINNGNWETYGSPLTITENGETIVETKTVDKAGNESGINSATIRIDNVVPELTITSEPTQGKVTLTVEGTDKHSGVSRIQKPNGEWEIGTTIHYEVSENGTYTFAVEDYAGNTTTESIEVESVNRSNYFYKPTIDSLGKVVISTEVQTITANVSPINVADWRESGNNWRINVSAGQLTNGTYELPKGTMRLKPISDIDKVDGIGTMPEAGYTSTTSIDDGKITVATGINAQGEYNLVFLDNALEIVIEPLTAKVGVYESTIRWEMVNAP